MIYYCTFFFNRRYFYCPRIRLMVYKEKAKRRIQNFSMFLQAAKLNSSQQGMLLHGQVQDITFFLSTSKSKTTDSPAIYFELSFELTKTKLLLRSNIIDKRISFPGTSLPGCHHRFTYHTAIKPDTDMIQRSTAWILFLCRPQCYPLFYYCGQEMLYSMDG